MAKARKIFWDEGVDENGSPAPFDVNKILRMTKDVEARIAREQATLAKRSPAQKLRGQAGQAARGIELERHHRKTGNRDALAEAFAMQGRFADAARMAVRKDLVAEYEAAASASEGRECGCDRVTGAGVPVRHIVREAFSIRARKPVYHVRCGLCGSVFESEAIPPDVAVEKEESK